MLTFGVYNSASYPTITLILVLELTWVSAFTTLYLGSLHTVVSFLWNLLCVT